MALEGAEGPGEPTPARTAALLASKFLEGLGKGIFLLDSRGSIHRTALVLIAYLLVHVVSLLQIEIDDQHKSSV